MPNKYRKRFDPRRFRANIYVNGPAAYAEDDWKMIKIGSAVYHVSCRTARCKVPNNDINSGVMDTNEPFTT
jgi:uncharacterized protein YcbX